MKLRKSQDVGNGSAAPSGRVAIHRPPMTCVDTYKEPEVQSNPIRTNTEESHSIDTEEEGDYVIKVENAEECEEQVDINFGGEEIEIDIKEEDLIFKEDSSVSRSDQVPHSKRDKEDLGEEEPPPVSAQSLHQDPTHQQSHREHESDMSAPVQESELQQFYPKVLTALHFKSDDVDLHTELLEETYVNHLLKNATNQNIWTTSSSFEPEPLRSESITSVLSCPEARRKRCVQHYEQTISLALKVVPTDSAMPSYSHCIARVIEIILNECPEDKQMLCGQQILTAALQIQLKMKNKSTSL